MFKDEIGDIKAQEGKSAQEVLEVWVKC